MTLGAFQESSADVIDIVGMFDHCTRYNSLVTHPNQLEKKLTAALTKALQSPKGPAHLSVPADILLSPAYGQAAFPNLQHLLTGTESVLDSAKLEKLFQELRNVLSQDRQVVLLIGHDCNGATKDIMDFAELTGSLIITTQRGKSWINPYHPLARGVFGFAGHDTARKALIDESVGLILAVGTNLGEWSTAGWDPALLNEKLVHIHNATTYFTRSPMARLHVYGTISAIFEELVSRLREGKIPVTGSEKEHETSTRSHADNQDGSVYVPAQIEVQAPDRFNHENDSPLIKPQRLIREIIQRFPPETRFLIDNCNSVPWTIHYFFHRHPENYHLPIGFASMGWAIGAAVGMALGKRGTPVVCFTGDGSFLMNGQEITVAVKEGLPVIYVVLNDQSFGMIRHAHNIMGAEQVDFSIPPVDFNMMAKAMGVNAHTIRYPKDFEQIDYHALCSRNGPTLLDVYVDPDEAPPLGMF
ncbi:MAG: thiamine pyrophosphate-binding protein [Deltaproteobacteria bacterium]|nr:thiamine pyrophosphate-binding protein [Deltaproteobacteria bacterium]